MIAGAVYEFWPNRVGASEREREREREREKERVVTTRVASKPAKLKRSFWRAALEENLERLPAWCAGYPLGNTSLPIWIPNFAVCAAFEFQCRHRAFNKVHQQSRAAEVLACAPEYQNLFTALHSKSF